MRINDVQPHVYIVTALEQLTIAMSVNRVGFERVFKIN